MLFVSEPDRAPFRLTFETSDGERMGIVVYAFFANSKETPTPPTSPSEGAVLSEVEVLTASGGWVRGVLISLEAGDHIVIRLANGEERRYPWATVEGFRPVPARTAPAEPLVPPAPTPRPSSPPSTPTVVGSPPNRRDAGVEGFDPDGQPLFGLPSVEVSIEGASPGLRLQVVTGYDNVGTYSRITNYGGHASVSTSTVFQPRFMTLCRAPCTLRLAIGRTYHLHVGSDAETNSHLPTSSRRLRVTADVTSLTLGFQNRSRFRRRAWWSVGVMPVLGALMTGLSKAIPPGHFGGGEYGRNNGIFWTGVGLMCTPAASYAVPMLVRDRSRVRVRRRRH